MNRNSTALIILALLIPLAGCQHSGTTTTSQPRASQNSTAPPAVGSTPAPPTATANPSSTVPTQVTSAVDALIAQQETAKYPCLPHGVKLRSVTLKDDVATLDFNSRFNSLANMGDTTESQAQKALRTAVGTVNGVEKMNVTVDGKPFDSQMTDWSTPFDVHYQTDEGGSESPDNTTSTGSN